MFIFSWIYLYIIIVLNIVQFLKIHILFYLITTITVTTVMDIFYVYLFKEFHHRYLLLKKPTK